MNLSAFFGVVATIDFALLGLWWVAVQARPDLREHGSAAARMAYVVSLQFVVPGTASLLALVDPAVTMVWRVSFAIAGVTGILAILFCLVVLLSAQVAWAAAMSTDPDARPRLGSPRAPHGSSAEPRQPGVPLSQIAEE